MGEKISRNARLILFLTLVAANAFVWYAVFYYGSRERLVINFFDVGQGDAALIEIPGGYQVLIDGGPSDAILGKLGSSLPFWDRDIDVVVLSHPHADHLTGLVHVLRRYGVDYAVSSGAPHPIPEYQEWKRLLENGKTQVVRASCCMRIIFGDAALEIFAPSGDMSMSSPRNVHDAMVIARLVYGSASVLFTGDAERPLEHRLIYDSGLPVASRVLKVGHHGSRTSTSEEFLHAVSPEVAVIQAGAQNRYGHPHAEVVKRLEDFGAGIFRNDRYGDIVMVSDGRRIDFSTAR